ncbi:group II intron maturase-specific domain-containing protein [Faecalicatena contorta]|uniref:group II intron maturase-specific domain-containing protein n=1 Tax=Faecalicatena contorta TaxID=39482 RepID=UPI00241C12DB
MLPYPFGVIRGWTNYHKHTVASYAFSYVNNTLYLLLQRWAKHRHPNCTGLCFFCTI